MDYSQYPTNRSDAKATGAKYYFTGISCKHGHITLRKTKGSCVECIKDETRKYAEKRKDYFREYSKSKAAQDAKRRYYEQNRELVIARALARPVEKLREYRKRYKSNNPEVTRASLTAYKRKHRDATPHWLSSAQRVAIRDMYLTAQRLTKITGERYVVDHIVPLRNKIVCGLHVPWNLRVITQEDNLRKSNRLM